MIDFLLVLNLSAALITLCSFISYEIMRTVWRILPTLTIAPHLRVLVVIVPVFALHILGIWIYAGAYFLIENITSIGVLAGGRQDVGFSYESFLDCLYFSTTTYTSLGFGDLTPTDHLRMVAGAEVLNGLVMITWTASFTYLAMEKFWQLPHKRGAK